MSSRLDHDAQAMAPESVQPFGGRSPAATLIASVVAALLGIGACVAAVLVPAPPAALVPVLAVSAGGPLIAGHAATPVVASWRARRTHRFALRRLRAALDRLPEIEHPLDR